MLQLLALAAALATPTIDLPKLFAHQLPRVKARTEVPILLPQKLPDEFDSYFPTGSGHRKSWDLEIGAAKNCGGATACFVADFTGRTGGQPFGRRKVRLARGRIGYFQPLSCGASCSPPSIEWHERGATFSIQAKVAVKGSSDRAVLTGMASSAIRHGPR